MLPSQGRLKTGRKKLLLHLSPALSAAAARDGADADPPGPEPAAGLDPMEHAAVGAVAQRMERLEKVREGGTAARPLLGGRG